MSDETETTMKQITRRKFLGGLTLAGISVPMVGAVAAGQSQRPSRQITQKQYEAMTAAARNYLNTLSTELRAKAVFPFKNEERFHWHYIPTSVLPVSIQPISFARKGVRLKEMTKEQRVAAHSLLQSALSTQGYLKATSIIHLEEVLRDLEISQGKDAKIVVPIRDSENYFFTIFGTPSKDEPWGWRVEGHHLSLNFSSISSELVAVTPAFMGANPALVPSGTHAGSRILAAEEDIARELLAKLDIKQSSQAIIATTAPNNIITENSRKAILKEFAGLPALKMDGAQRELLMRLIEEYVNNVRPDFARSQLKRIQAVGVEKIHFAWAGGVERGQPHYYRLHSPALLIEYDNTDSDANHIHSVCRDLENDFAEDMLLKHYKESNHHK